MISGSTFLVLASPTTAPIGVAGPARVEGKTTILPSGETGVIVQGGQTVGVGNVYSVSGRTTIVSGSTQVVVSGSQTVVLKPTATGAGVAFVQASDARRQQIGVRLIFILSITMLSFQML